MEGNFCRCFRRVNSFGKTCGMERRISISELSVEMVMLLQMLTGRLLETRKDHVDDSTTEVC